MVKNNILFSVLLASFAAPVFASLIPGECPYPTLSEKGAFVATFAAVDTVSSRYTCLPRAVEFYKNQPTIVAPVITVTIPSESEGSSNATSAAAVESKEASASLTATSTGPTEGGNTLGNGIDNHQQPTQTIKTRVTTFLQEIWGTNVSFGLQTVGVDGGVNVKVLPAAVKIAATCVAFDLGKKAVSFATKKISESKK